MNAIETSGSSTSEAKDRLVSDMKLVIKDAEELLRNAGQQTGEGFKNAKAKFESTLADAREELLRVERTVVDKTRDAADATDRYVKEHPWQSVGLAAALGVICGLLIGRRG